MAKKLLKGYIPLGAPLNWEATGPEDPAVRCVVGFTTNWFHLRAGADFSERYHIDPDYRFENLMKMKQYVQQTFPQLECFREHDGGGFEQECATVSNVYGVCLMAMLYGLKPTYYSNMWPAMHPKERLSVEEIKALKPIDVANHPVVQQLFEQMEHIAQKWGIIDGYLNFQGVLNNAFKLRGADIFMDMVDDPGLCHFLFEHITNTMIDLAKLVQKRQRESGLDVDCFVTSNCVVNMVSPENYIEYVLPYDRKLADAFPAFGIHSCNWKLDPYAKVFSSIEKVGYIDLGFHSDMKLIKSCFPDCRRMVFYDPEYLMRKSEQEVKQDVERMCQELGPCDICLPDVEVDVADEKICMFHTFVQQAAEQMQA